MVANSARSAALAVLRAGRVTVTYADGGNPPTEVSAMVQSSQSGRKPWLVECVAGWWDCTCPTFRDQYSCKHVDAVRLVTGHPTPAREIRSDPEKQQ